MGKNRLFVEIISLKWVKELFLRSNCNWMIKFIKYCLAAGSLLFAACSVERVEEKPINGGDDGKILVSIGQSINIKSRTGLDSDGYSSVWTAGDQIAVWAEGSDGTFDLEATKFTMHRFTQSLNQAVFTAFINPLEEDNYIYYSTYPTPTSVSGTQATYSIPTEQNGSQFVGSCDIMVAEPVLGSALKEGIISDFNFHFLHKMHALRIVLPDDGKLMDTPIDRIEFTFPTAVVGDVVVDATDPYTPAVLTNGSKQLNISIPDGYKAGDYIWAMIFPKYISGEVKYRVYAGEYISVEKSITFEKNAQESHISPMRVAIPDPYLTTTITIAIDENHLGETPTNVSIYDLSGNQITISNYDYSKGRFDVLIDGVLDGPSLKGQQYKVRFESANAIVEETITLPAIKSYYQNEVAIDVPYLLFEDFSQAKAYEQNDAYTPTDSNENNASYRKGYLLDGYMPDNGWNAARFKIDAGNCIRLNVRYQSGAWIVGRYCGRLDTPALKAIKSGSSVNVRIEFDLACYVPFGYKLGIGSIVGANELFDDTNNSVTFYQISKHTSSESSTLNGDNQGDISSEYSSPTFVRNFTEDTFKGTFWAQSVNISGCGSTTRLTWWPSTAQNSRETGANCVYYIYIDNIRVSIAQ